MSKYTCSFEDGCDKHPGRISGLCHEHLLAKKEQDRYQLRLRRSERETWLSMIRRCTDPRVREYKWYGGRGITVCDEWLGSYDKFIEHIGPKPDFSRSIDRIDNDGNYEPGNVRWATMKQQFLNSSNPFGRRTSI
jgi:hypothetical protein